MKNVTMTDRLSHFSFSAEGKTHKRAEIIALITVAGTLIAAIVLCFLWRWITRRGNRYSNLDSIRYYSYIDDESAQSRKKSGKVGS